MVKAKLADGCRQIGVRLPEPMYAALEQHLAKMQKESAPGVEIKLADAARNIFALGLEAAKGSRS